MEQLHAGELHILVASDLAVRGLDVDGITHVINFDLPEDPEIYVHRIGRTARAGRGGVAFSFVSPDQGDLLTQVEQLANTHVPAHLRRFQAGAAARGCGRAALAREAASRGADLEEPLQERSAGSAGVEGEGRREQVPGRRGADEAPAAADGREDQSGAVS
ncbi:MAG: helicase-related protein [Phycisphaerales bacterium]